MRDLLLGTEPRDHDIATDLVPAAVKRLLPDADDGLAALEAQLAADSIDRWLGEMQADNVEVALPRFKIESSFLLKEALARLGMVRAFEPQSDNFQGILRRMRMIRGT